MNPEQQTEVRYFVSYSGIKLPLKLVNEITEASLNNRNTYYRGYFNPQIDRVTDRPTFDFSSTSVCQQYQATTECKLAPDLDTEQEPAY